VRLTAEATHATLLKKHSNFWSKTAEEGISAMIEPEAIKQKVNGALPGSLVEVEDLTGGRDHFRLLVVSPLFEGKGVMDQHQMVYAALKEEMQGAIHALSLKTCTPAEWDGLEKKET
jgi:stress-induced morphogen